MRRKLQRLSLVACGLELIACILAGCGAIGAVYQRPPDVGLALLALMGGAIVFGFLVLTGWLAYTLATPWEGEVGEMRTRVIGTRRPRKRVRRP